MAQDLSDEITEIPQLIKAYATQELIDPLRSVGQYIAFGVIGAVFVGLGIVMLLLAALRAMQYEAADTFDGNLSVVPYLIVTLVGVGVLTLIGVLITKGIDDV